MVAIDSEFKALIPPLSEEERICGNCSHLHYVKGEDAMFCDARERLLIDASVWHIAKDCAYYVNENQIRIDEEFKALIPPLSEEERELLEASIVADGCRDALVLWDGILIDGHHRHEICTRLGIEFKTVGMPYLATRNDAMMWIIRNQLGRRNLTNYQRAELVLKLKPAIAEKAKDNERLSGEQFGKGLQNSANPIVPIDTRDELAKASGLSHDTIHKADFIGQHADEETKQALRTGETSINREYTRLKDPQNESVAHVSHNSGNNEWYTPSEFIDAARAVMGGIDLDPASSDAANALICATEFYTVESDGLTKKWNGRVWMNPPYAQDLIKRFSEKLLSELPGIEQAVVLVNNATETAWFQSLLGACRAVCFLRGRIKYLDVHGSPRNTPLQGQAILYFGDREEMFSDVFSELGQVLIHG